MAKLTSAQRKALPARDFAIPERREFPIMDEEHAKDALARVKAPGHTASEVSRVKAAVQKRYPKMAVK